MENKRFFAFGCSFTNYAWPTWADILGRNYIEYFNYGQYGSGNHYIFNALMEADQYHKISKDDLVIVQWSCSSREDRYKNEKWITTGGVANYYTDEELNKFFDFRGFVIRDLALIKAAKSFLDNVGCEYDFISMVPFVNNNMYEDIFAAETEDVAEVYKDILSVIKPSYEEILGKYSHRRPKLLHGVQIDDNHPLPSEHYEYVKQVLPHLLKEPKDIADQLDKKLAEVWNSDYQGWTYIWPDKKKAKKEKRL
jgi:hypothetical protein